VSVNERSFQRLLRWYPRRWRRDHGRILLSTLLDAAEHDGRETPTGAERIAAAVHGTAARLGRRFAVVASAIAVLCAVAGGVLWVLASGITGWTLTALTGVSAVSAALALLAALRTRGLIGDGCTLIAAVAGVVALVLNSLTAVSWILGFDEADAGIPVTGIAALWLPLAIGAWIAGAIAIGIIVDGVFRGTRLQPVPRIALSALVGVISAPLSGLTLFAPYGSAIAAMGVSVIAVLPQKRGATAIPAPRPVERQVMERSPGSHAGTRRRLLSTACLLAWIATAAGILGVVYAFTGSQWSAGATDTTVAMGQGMTILFLSAVPLIAAIGLVLTARPRHVGRLHIWGPLTLFVAALGGLFFWYIDGASSGDVTPAFFVGTAAFGAGIGWWIIPRVRLPRTSARMLGAFAGLIVAASGLLFAVIMLSFAVPILAFIVAIRSLPGRAIPAAPPSVTDATADA